MLNYPKTYQTLTAEEMEYASGGAIKTELTITPLFAVAASGIGMLVLEYVNLANIAVEEKKLKEENPEKYTPAGVKTNIQLFKDAWEPYFSTHLGATMGVLNAAAAALFMGSFVWALSDLKQ